MAIINGNGDLAKKAPKERSPEDKARVEAMKARIEAQNAAKAQSAPPARGGMTPPAPPRVGEMPAELVEKIAREVIQGKWDVGQARVDKLKAAGYDADAVQKKVNELLK